MTVHEFGCLYAHKKQEVDAAEGGGGKNKTMERVQTEGRRIEIRKKAVKAEVGRGSWEERK